MKPTPRQWALENWVYSLETPEAQQHMLEVLDLDNPAVLRSIEQLTSYKFAVLKYEVGQLGTRLMRKWPR